MSFAETEYNVAEKAVRAERRMRRFIYFLVFVGFGIFCWVAYEQSQIRNDNRRFVEEVRRLTANAVEQNRIQNEETRRYHTCLLLIPIEKRTPEAQRACFESGNVPGGLESDDFTPVTRGDDAGAVARSNAVPNSLPEKKDSEVVSSAQSNNNEQASQQDSSQEPEQETREPEPVAPAPPTPLQQITDLLINLIQRIL